MDNKKLIYIALTTALVLGISYLSIKEVFKLPKKDDEE